MSTQNAAPERAVSRPEHIAVGCLTDAQSYFHSATVLDAMEDGLVHIAPIYFLLCHTIELLLKAYLLSNGVDARELQKSHIRHQLKELGKASQDKGLNLSEHSIAIIDMLAPHHENHSFRYRKTGFKSFPLPSEIRKAIAEVLQTVGPVVVNNLWAQLANSTA
jgi:hypothetical protein